MPNHCNNRLSVSGDNATIAEFIQRVTVTDDKGNKTYEILRSLYPTPKELADTPSGFSTDENEQAERVKREEANVAKYGYKDWYDWNNANWGTKWGDYDTYVDGEPISGEVEFQFDSAWAPPVQGIAHVAQLFPTLRFVLRYNEGGCCFYGVTVYHSDGSYEDDCRNYDDIEGYAQLVEAINHDDNDDWVDIYETMDTLVLDALDSLATSMGV